MKSFVILLVSFLIIAYCNLNGKNHAASGVAVPLVRILSTPERYDGKRISTIGILRILDFESEIWIRLYADEGYARHNAYYSYISIGDRNDYLKNRFDDIMNQDSDMKFARVEGVFRNTTETEKVLHSGFRNTGYIYDISRIQILKEPK